MKESKKIQIQTLWLLWIIAAAGSLYIFHNYIVGNHTVAFFDYGTDGKDQYIMWYNGIVNSFRDGNFSTWDFRNGFGMNTMGHNLTEPFLIPVFILGVLFGPEHLTHYMVWVEVIRILFSATAIYFFLSEFDFTERSKLIAAVLYTFNAYMMVWGQHYALGSAVVYFPLLLLFVEKVRKKKKFGIGLCLVTCLILLSSFYQGYMCMLAGGIYVVIRVLMMEDTSWKERGKVFLLSAGSMILGLGMAACRFLPSAAAQVGSSARLEPRASFFERVFLFRIWPVDVLKTILYRMFSSCIQGNGNEAWVGYKNFYEAPELFFSTLFIILLIQYLLLLPRMRESKKKMIAQYLIVLLCTASIVFSNLTTVFNGFYKPFFRHTFVLMPVFGVMCAKVLDYILKEKRVSVIGLIAAAGGMSAVYLKAYTIFPEQQFKNNAMILLLTGLFMVVLLFSYCKMTWADMQSVYVLLVAAVTVNIVADSFLCYNYRVTLTKDHPTYYAKTYHSDVDAALRWIEEQDQTFYRVEKDYFTAASCLDALAQDYRGMSAYNTNQNANIKEFVAKLWPQLYYEKDIYHMQFSNAIWDTTLSALSDVKYVLSKSDQLNLNGYTKIGQEGEVSIYRNEMADSLGKFYTAAVTEETLETAREEMSLYMQKLLKEVLIVENRAADQLTTLDKEKLAFCEKEKFTDITVEEIKESYETSDTLDLELHLKEDAWASAKEMIFSFTINAEKRTVMNITMDDGYEHSFVQNWDGTRTIHVEVPAGTKKICLQIPEASGFVHLGHLQFYGSKEAHDFNREAQILIDAPEKDSRLTGRITVPQDGIVMLAIPMEKGWNIYLDGTKQDIFAGDYGFIAFQTPAGEHELKAVFKAPLLREGTILSTICIILFLVICMAGRFKNKGART